MKYRYLINRMSDQDKNYIYKSLRLLLDYKMKNRNIILAKQCYQKAKKYGGLSRRDKARRIAFAGRYLFGK